MTRSGPTEACIPEFCDLHVETATFGTLLTHLMDTSGIRRIVRNIIRPLKPWQRIPTMLHPNELRNLHDRAKEVKGAGLIADLGTWLGGSTGALAAGISANDSPATAKVKVHAYDLFLVDDFSKEQKLIPEIQQLNIGDSFLPTFLKHMAPWKNRVEAHQGDLTQQQWVGGPIELMHVDIMKNWDLTNHVSSAFYPHLIPGRSIIIHQDFAHYWTGWIHLHLYRLRNYLEPVQHVPHTSSFVFRLRTVIPAEALNRKVSPDDLDPTEVAAAFEWSRSIMPKDAVQRFTIDAAEAMLCYHLGDKARCAALTKKATEAESEFKRQFPDHIGRSELRLVQRFVDKG